MFLVMQPLLYFVFFIEAVTIICVNATKANIYLIIFLVMLIHNFFVNLVLLCKHKSIEIKFRYYWPISFEHAPKKDKELKSFNEF